jgi:predicted RNA binding protein YcfA (HicA-like mRNA interferase family)
MSRPGFRTPNEARVVRDARARGWEVLGRSGTNHVQLRWPASGEITTVPSSMDDGFARAIMRRLQRLEKET